MTRTTPELLPPLQTFAPHQREYVWPPTYDLACNRPNTHCSSEESGFGPGAFQPQDLTTRPRRPQQHFRTYDDVTRWSTQYFASKEAKFNWGGIHTLADRWGKCLAGMECTASCLPGFYFERLKNINLITLRCREEVWTPLQEFPPCRPGPRCTLRARGDGHFHCTSDEDGAHCDVTCDGNFKGQYHCSLREWSPSLPHCVVPAAEKPIALCQDPGKKNDLVRRNADGTAADNTRNFEEGESIRFLCKKKIKTLHGHSLITCRPDGTWSGALPYCTNTSISG
ncbi:hypothetical protein AVEN_84078-1 [Araneus ventricosus]|uniref:Sushi domain-containing protein n=1 Tax=Araneus ventricosus TaxID=182803 RepID=A0A4Y2GJ72_ARAVE|nr:hypothetical protein AVEN_84078-1 [Araneus ventricosus]